MKKKRILSFLFLCLFLVLLTSAVGADIGNLNRYDNSGGGSYSTPNFGGGSSSSSSGGFRFFPVFFGSGSFGGITNFLFIAAIVVAVAFFIMKTSKASPDTKQYTRPAPSPDVSNRSAEITARILKTDPDFSAEQFLTFVKDTYLSLQTAWMEKDLEKVRLLESEELFHQHKVQLEEYIRLGRKNMMERIAVGNTYFVDVSSDGTSEHLKVFLSAVMRDYIIDEKTGNVIAGRKDVDSHMSYLLTFTRSAGSVTKKAGGVNTINCPSCGAPTEITASGKCTYCGSSITSGKYTWVLSNLEKA